MMCPRVMLLATASVFCSVPAVGASTHAGEAAAAGARARRSCQAWRLLLPRPANRGVRRARASERRRAAPRRTWRWHRACRCRCRRSRPAACGHAASVMCATDWAALHLPIRPRPSVAVSACQDIEHIPRHKGGRWTCSGTLMFFILPFYKHFVLPF